MPKTPLQKDSSWQGLAHSWGNKEVYAFPRVICSKVNVIARLEFELAHFDVTGTVVGNGEGEPSSNPGRG